MVPLAVHLPDDLHTFVRRAISDGSFTTADELFTYAVSLLRRELMLGKAIESDVVSFHTPEPAAADIWPKAVETMQADERLEEVLAPTGSQIVAVDLTRKGFDSPAFMANLIGRIEKKTADERRDQKLAQQGQSKPK